VRLRICHDADRVAAAVDEFVHIVAQIVELREDLFRVEIEDLAVFVELDLAADIVEKGHADLFFELADHLREEGLGNAQLVGRFGDVFELRSHAEVLQIANFHSCPP